MTASASASAPPEHVVPDQLDRLRDWFAGQLADSDRVEIAGVDRVTFGHSAETLLLTLAWRDRGGEHRRDVVLRVRPAAPGLLEPYDLARQFAILRALEPTPVPSPRVLWYEPTGAVLGSEFYVMERCAGTVYEADNATVVAHDPERLRRMSRDLVATLAGIHRVDATVAELAAFRADDHVGHELAHWTAEMQRVRRARLPALELLARCLEEQRPECSEVTTLVHGDVKPGNFAFIEDAVSAVFDWELATVGDPRTDLGYLECMWTIPSSFTARAGALTRDEAVAVYEQHSGIEARDRGWYRALGGFKLAVIMLVGAMLFDCDASDDPRLAMMGYGVQPFTDAALLEVGVAEPPKPGPVTPRRQRMRTLRARPEDA
jgi:aminoglycoside phosphotransferase (APT) family kinase protein